MRAFQKFILKRDQEVILKNQQQTNPSEIMGAAVRIS